MTTQHEFAEEPIAIVGSACRFPGASNSPSKLWDLLRQPRDVLKEFDPDRLNLQRFYHPDGDVHGSTDVQNKSYLLEEDNRLFDAPFFGISPLEASGMDPQQRVLLEVVYEALESAGVTLDQLRGSLTSVHVGVMTADYANIQLRDLETISKYAATGTGNSILSNRISYTFDLKGPSETIDTACSSSLVALHHAARGLLSGDSEAAVVAGVNLIFDPASYITESKLHMLSPDSRSRMWDESANGYARGEGAAALLLKPLSRALKDGDHVEGLLRGTGVNSDGQSPGITMPFAPAQAALIRQTYRRAGLDLVKDRPQFFECHGTGTPAGDPVEAQAISESLLAGHGHNLATEEPIIYVGSIKTVIGHLEGCAGVAGVIKALLALKNRTIPPNLFFNKLNPAIAPYYGPLQIATAALPWPELPAGTPARASVNSFGFGGTNAHAIIESFDNDNANVNGSSWGQRHDHVEDDQDSDHEEGILGPLLFSAASGASLLATVRAHLQHLRHHSSLDLRDLSWTLQTRRSTHRVRAHFSGASRDSILESMAGWVTDHDKAASSQVGYQPQLINPSEVPGILGIFTGQGAQWPAMGRELMKKSPLFRRTVRECEATLGDLPVAADAPEWSLAQELMADGPSSRVSEAEIAQPLCTAVQIALVDLLAAAGITFHAVVGHSSGEIAATYAAGIITLRGAMQIAYYRGLYAGLAVGANGERGGMLAAGLSLDKALQFCRRPEFQGRIQVAASNAPQSVTLSGDVDAIHEAKRQLDADNVFVRQLKVDTAYHSHHMEPCAEPYLRSLLACDIEVRLPSPGACVWNSSVRGDTELLRRGDLSALKGPYWVANMVQTVLFSKAVESSIWHGGPWDLAIEVGPHPALRGPVEQTIKAVFNSVPLYTGTLSRNNSDVAAFSAAVGATWAQLGPSFVDFDGYRGAFYESQPPPPAPRLVKDLPPYSWDHHDNKVYWRESRISRRYRTGRDGGHELLGRRAPDDNDRELRWRNVLRLPEMPWLRGHEVLGEVLLPAAAYVSVALEAGKRLAVAVGGGAKRVRLLEVENVDIRRPVVVPDDKDGVETLFTMCLLDNDSASASPSSSPAASDVLRARFEYYVCKDESIESMIHTCSGSLSVHLGHDDATHSRSGEEQAECLPPRDAVPPNLGSVDGGQVYSMFGELGLKYSGAFRAITDSSRCLNYATARGSWPEGFLSHHYVVHPALLDVAFQTVFVARAHPASRQITSAFLPAHIDRVRVSPSVEILPPSSLSDGGGNVAAEFEAWIVAQTASSLTGDLNVYDAGTGQTFLQVEGLVVKLIGEPDAAQDRHVFSKTAWARDASLGLADPVRDPVKEVEALRKTEATERFALFYMRRVVEQIGAPERTAFQWYHQRMFEAFEQRLDAIREGQNSLLPSSWLADEVSVIEDIYAANPEWVDLQLIRAVGENLAGVVRGETQLLEVMNRDDMLNRVYMDSETFLINDAIAGVLRQITFKFPRCNILEVGAGTGGTTWSVLNTIDDAYDSYTYTDISSGFFQKATSKFSGFADKMVFKTLDVEKPPSAQGFSEQAYDVIIAANVLHVTRSLHTTMRNVRSLLRPGGYLVMMETTGLQSIRGHLVFGGLPGWWLSEEAGRRLGPVVPAADWDVILRETGFSGAGTVMHDLADASKHTTSLIVSQAVDDAWLRLRDPLSWIGELRPPSTAEPLLLVGGNKPWTSQVMGEILRLLPGPWGRHVRVAGSIDDIDPAGLTPGVGVICLHEADDPLFATPMTADRMSILQSLLINTRVMLWVTGAGRSGSGSPSQIMDPRAAMFHGIARVAPTELPHLQVQVLGLDIGAAPAAVAGKQCLEAFLRLRESENDDDDGDKPRVLWSHEPEVEVLADGIFMIPREVPDKALNERYNSSRRAVTKTVDATDVAVRAVAGPANKMVLQDAADMDMQPADDDEDQELPVGPNRTRIQVKYSLHIPSENGKGVYLVCGHHQESDTVSSSPVMAISNTNASVVDVKPGVPLVAIADHDCTPAVLVSTASRMLARAIAILASQQAPPRPVFLYAPEESLATMVAAELELALKGGGEGGGQFQHAYFASCSPDTPDAWIKMHPRALKRAALMAMPRHVQLYVDCVGYYSSAAENPMGDTLRACLPPGCVARQLDARLIQEAALISGQAAALLEGSYLQVKGFSSGADVNICDCKLFKAAELAGASVSPLMHTRFITDWQERESLLLTTRPLDPRGLFKPDKTYLMVGCAGGLGLSICWWMMRNGAKHIVITSRNPQVDARLLEDARRLHGASLRVTVIAMDVSNKDSVQQVVAQLAQDANMPPVAGICNAAMVLADKLFVDMDVDQLNSTLAPKVCGTSHLDAAFAEVPLDFFVVLSSTAAVIGNVGQANYHVANLFMAGLVAARRARGRAGSVVHVGHVADVGYVMRQDRGRGLEQHFRDIRLMPLSETEVHHAFAEAVRGGRPGGGGGSHDIIMGLDPPTEPPAPGKTCVWLSNPRLGHFVPFSALQTEQQDRAATNMGGVRRRVEEARSEDEAVAAVLEAFCSRLESILQLPDGSVKENVRQAVIGLGIDSLVAVELRTWFLKELGADVPVVKILGGDTVLQLCTLAAKKMMAKNMKKKAQEVVVQQDVSETENTTPADSAVSSRGNNSSETEASSSTKTELSDADAASERSSSSPAAVGAVKPPHETTHHQQMSPAQARIWFMSKHFLADPAAYNMVFHYHVQGPLSMARLRHALHATTHHHDCLRMRFYARPGDGVPMQGVIAAPAYDLKHVRGADESDVHREVGRLKSRAWDLENGDTFGVTVLSRGDAEEQHDIVFSYHHIVMDATGWHVFIRDLDRAYRMRLLDKTAAGSHLEYSALLQEQEKSGAFDEHLSFWQAEFETLPEPLPLLPAFARLPARPADPTGEGSHHQMRELQPAQFAAIKETCQGLNINPFHLHLAVLQVLLARHAGSEDVCLGVVDANRSGDARFAQTVGCLINMLPVRFRVPRHAAFSDVARAASGKALAAFSHAAVPLEMVLDRVRAPRSPDCTPLFQVAVNYRTGSIDDLPLGDECRMRLAGGKDAEDPYDISWGFIEGGARCAVQMHCQAALYSREACEAMLDEYLGLLERVLMDPEVRVDQCGIWNHDIPSTVSTATATGGRLDGREPVDTTHPPQREIEAADDEMTVGEGELRLLWERVLPESETRIIAPSADFFLSGGNSLLLMQLQAAIRESVGVAVATRALYGASTLREMARCVDEERHPC